MSNNLIAVKERYKLRRKLQKIWRAISRNRMLADELAKPWASLMSDLIYKKRNDDR